MRRPQSRAPRVRRPQRDRRAAYENRTQTRIRHDRRAERTRRFAPKPRAVKQAHGRTQRVGQNNDVFQTQRIAARSRTSRLGRGSGTQRQQTRIVGVPRKLPSGFRGRYDSRAIPRACGRRLRIYSGRQQAQRCGGYGQRNKQNQKNDRRR